MTWCICHVNLLLLQSQLTTGYLKTVYQPSMQRCNQNHHSNIETENCKCPPLVHGLCHPSSEVRTQRLSSTPQQQVTLVNLTHLSKAPPLWSHVWAVTHTHTNRGRQTYSVQTKTTRGNKEQERERWQCWSALTNPRRETVLGQRIPCASQLWLQPKPLTARLPDRFNSPPSARPSGALGLGVQYSRYDYALIQGGKIMSSSRECGGRKTWQEGWEKRK